MSLYSIIALLVLCAVMLSTDAASLRIKRGVFGTTSYTGQKNGRNPVYRQILGVNKLTHPSAKPKPKKGDKPSVLAEITHRQDAACSITYDGECVPEHLAILPLNIHSRTICGPGWVCYE